MGFLLGFVGVFVSYLYQKSYRLKMVMALYFHEEIIRFSFSAYSNCVNEPFCAARSVQGYMAKFGQVIN